jgi:hypothetical protein
MRLAETHLVSPVVLREFTLEAGEENVPVAEVAVKSAIRAITKRSEEKN